MKQPTLKELNKLSEKQVKRLADINVSSFTSIFAVRNYVKDNLKAYMDNKRSTRLLEAYIIAKYIKMFKALKTGVIDSYNTSMSEQIIIASKTVGVKIPFSKSVKQLPNTKAFRITNRVLNDKSVSIRSQKMAKQVTKLIGSATKNGYGVEKTAKLLDIQFGIRDKKGRLTKKAIKLMEQGRITHTNGHFYQTYRIARTESMRMVSISNYDTFDELKSKGYNVRAKLKAYIDSRTREQSASMNGQISDADGYFIYPNGGRYRLGSYELPAKYSVQDRETFSIIYLD